MSHPESPEADKSTNIVRLTVSIAVKNLDEMIEQAKRAGEALDGAIDALNCLKGMQPEYDVCAATASSGCPVGAGGESPYPVRVFTHSPVGLPPSTYFEVARPGIDPASLTQPMLKMSIPWEPTPQEKQILIDLLRGAAHRMR